jgi:UDP-glucose 4-epimerase
MGEVVVIGGLCFIGSHVVDDPARRARRCRVA